MLAATLALVACGGSPTLVTLATPARMPRPAERDRTPLEVVTRGTGVADPLPVEGTTLAYGQVETALGWAILNAVTPWSDAHPANPGAGYQLTVELTRAEAKWQKGRLTISLGCRATLRNRTGNRYLAQTNARCDQAGLSAPEAGFAIFDSCTQHIGRTLASWLDGVPADGQSIPRLHRQGDDTHACQARSHDAPRHRFARLSDRRLRRCSDRARSPRSPLRPERGRPSP